MRIAIPAAAVLALMTQANAQNYCPAQFSNEFDVVSTATHAGTGRNYPANGLQPPGYVTAPGVPAGWRCWTYVPDERFHAASDPFQQGRWMTITGFTQTIFVGAAVTTFPTTTETYQMETGIAPAEPYASYFRHHSNAALPDLVRIPSSTLSVPAAGQAIFDHSFTLTTPIALPLSQQQKLILFATYRGGEWGDDPAGGQSLEGDWKGAWGIPGQIYQGFAAPPNASSVRTISPVAGAYRFKIGLILDEPVFHVGGFHGNRYDAGARQNERFRGTTMLACDWANQTWAGTAANMWFDFEGGARYGTGNGTFSALFSFDPMWWQIPIPYGFGNLLLNPGDPLLFGFTGASQLFTLDSQGHWFTQGAAYAIPQFGPAGLNQWIKMQGVVANLDPVAGVTDLALTNAISIKIIN